MTPDEIASFVRRLLQRTLTKEELSALTSTDLEAINAYLAEYAKSIDYSPVSRPEPRTYTEEEILTELGFIEA